MLRFHRDDFMSRRHGLQTFRKKVGWLRKRLPFKHDMKNIDYKECETPGMTLGTINMVRARNRSGPPGASTRALWSGTQK